MLELARVKPDSVSDLADEDERLLAAPFGSFFFALDLLVFEFFCFFVACSLSSLFSFFAFLGVLLRGFFSFLPTSVISSLAFGFFGFFAFFGAAIQYQQLNTS